MKLSITKTNHSKEIDNIIGAPPSWLIKWGVSLFLMVAVLILLLGHFVRFPQTVNGNAIVYNRNISGVIRPDADAKFMRFFVHEGQKIKTGQLIATLVSTDGVKRSTDSLNATQVGIVNLSDLVGGEPVDNNTPIYSIVTGQSAWYAEVFIPEQSAVNVRKGQAALVTLEKYPKQKFGILKAIVTGVANHRFMGRQKVTLLLSGPLPRGVVLSYGMKGSVAIVIREVSFLKRLLENVNFPR